MLRNGLFYKAQDVQKKECEVIDDNIVRHVGMTKISSGNKTPFQLLLEKIHSDQSILNDFDKLAQQLFDITPLKKANKSRLMSEKDQAIIDANNDNFRRFFESVFAKKILKYILNQESVSELRTMLQEISAFLIREYHDYDKNFLSLWEASRNGAKVKENDSLSFFSELRPDLVALMKEDHFSDAKKDTMLKLYDLHYMTHAISKLTSYKKRHPEGIVEIYDNEYKKRNTFYRPDHRGRVAGFGFAKDNPSYHLGIFRSHDQTPYDMRKTSLNPVTRCPDRLYMEHPKVARLDPYNWLHHCFSNGNNSCYVNGLSGSILLEIRSLLFFISALKDNYYSCVVLKPDAYLHHNIQPEDILAWPTNLGWMMGPWLIFAALMNKATLALYHDAPTDRTFGEFIQNAKVTMLGVVPTLVATWRQSHCMENLNWQSIKLFSSTGECSNPEDMLYLMSLAAYKPIIEYCGGTEIGGSYITSTLLENNYLSLFNTPTMGLDLVLLDEEGKPTNNGEVALIPPSIGLSTELLNADHNKIYYINMPSFNGKKLRRHGDQALRLANGCYSILGRVDDTMNLGGIKVSSAEIERVLAGITGIIETAAIAVSPPHNGPSQLVIYAATSEVLNEEDTKKCMQKKINQHLNPLFKIHKVVFINVLPKTASNKIMRRVLRAKFQETCC